MPEPQPFDGIEFTGGFWPSSRFDDSTNPSNIIRAGRNLWPRADGRQEPIKGLIQTSATPLGARMFEADVQRAEIGGALVSGRLPHSGLVRFGNSAYFFVGEVPNQQVYLNEVALPGVTTGDKPYTLRVAYQNPDNSWTCEDAGLNEAVLPSANVVAEAGGVKYTSTTAAKVSVKIAALDFKTNAQGNPSEAVQVSIVGGGANRIRVTLHSLALVAPRQDGWVLGVTPWKQGESGPWQQARPAIRIQLEGTFTATAGNPNITAGLGTKASLRLAKGDVVRIDGADYTVLENPTTDEAFKLSTNFAGATGAGKTVITRSVVLDYYNEELGGAMATNNDKPPKALAVINFNNRLMLVGCAETEGEMPGSLVLASRAENPEAYPRGDSVNQIQTAYGDSLLGVQTGNLKLFLLGVNGVDVANYTGDDAAPFLTRRVFAPGVASPVNAIAAGGQLYAFVGKKVIRILEDDTVDMTFATPVEDIFANWSARYVVLKIDPRNLAVLCCHYDPFTNETQVVPWMLALGVWGTEQRYAGQITDGATVDGVLYLMLLSGGNYRVQEYEGSNGTTTEAFAATEYLYGSNDTLRKALRQINVTGRASAIRIYLAQSGVPLSDVNNPALAVAVLTLSDLEEHELPKHINLPPCMSYALRVDMTGQGRYISRISTQGDYLPSR